MDHRRDFDNRWLALVFASVGYLDDSAWAAVAGARFQVGKTWLSVDCYVDAEIS